MWNPTRPRLAGVVGWLCLLASAATAQAPPPGSARSAGNEWRFYGGEPGGTRHSTLDQINRQNVGRLKVAWTYHMGELRRKPQVSGEVEPTAFESTPLVIDGMLYFTTPRGRVVALDADTGKEIWQYD